MSLPVRTCSAPNRSMIAVPLAATFPSTPRPVRRSNSLISSGGKPSGYVGKGLLSWIPQISQCPVVLSLPADAGRIRPQAEPLEVRQLQSPDGAREVPQRVAAGIAVAIRIGCGPRANAIEHDDDRAT